MPNTTDRLQSSLRRWTLVLGVLQVTVGCVVGFTPPDTVEWFRGIVMAHLEFTANGVLMIVLGLLANELHLNRTAWLTWFTTLQIGTWANGSAGLAAAILGASSPLTPTLNEKFPPPYGTASPVVTNLLLVCGITVLIALVLTLYGLLRSPDKD